MLLQLSLEQSRGDAGDVGGHDVGGFRVFQEERLEEAVTMAAEVHVAETEEARGEGEVEVSEGAPEHGGDLDHSLLG